MCFYSKLSKKAEEIESKLKAKFKDKTSYVPQQEIKAFDFPQIPIITSENEQLIDFFQWGLIPEFSNNDDIKQFTLNAKIETLHSKPSFQLYTSNRCLIPADGFYEWQWLDQKGKKKEKYLISLPHDELFCFAGIWSSWQNPIDHSQLNTFTIITTQANELMSEIHNSKKRMPIILTQRNQKNWLFGENLENFKNPKVDLVATKLNKENQQYTLF
ncbi:SOS response-associated peptidase [Namhaeicola litoreus]|uniref:Abasic site processing protein n=1 Tax=Namhaeicola litoreus TaxID=1052145 RepID=A0ABW3Y407_9FLAO